VTDTRSCPTNFDQSLISGALDRELTQAAEQRVRVHLEDCAACRALYEELATLREATMTTTFREPDDSQWNERPRGLSSGLSRSLGWIVAILWLVLTAGYGLWAAWTGTENLVERLLVFGGVAGLALLFLSVLLDRVRASRSDRYREVER
jgi:hypothetical protein